MILSTYRRGRPGVTLILLIAMLSAARLAQADVSLSLVCGSVSDQATQVTVTAAISEDLSLGALDATVSWNPSLLEFVSIEDGTYGALNTNTSQAASGSITFNTFKTAGQSGSFTLGVLNFQPVAGATGDATVEMTVTEISAAQTFADLLNQTTVVPCSISLGEEAPPAPEGFVVRFDGPAEVDQGASIAVTLTASVPEDMLLGAFDATLRWDADLLDFVSIEDGTYGALNANTSQAASGYLTFNSFDASGQNGTLTLAVVSFTASGSGGTAEVEIEFVEVSAARTFDDLLPQLQTEPHQVAISSEIEPGPISIDFDLDEGDQQQRKAGNAAPGKTYDLQLVVSEAPEINGWNATIEFDPSQVRYVGGSFQASGFIPGLLALADEKEGSVSVGGTVLGSDAKYSGDGVLGTLSFEILEDFTGSANLVITQINFRRVDGVEDKQTVRSLATLTSEVLVEELPGDFDGNGKVDFSDFFLFADGFGGSDPKYDLDKSGGVDFSDFFIFADNFGREAQAK